MSFTEYPDIDKMLNGLQTDIKTILQNNLVGIYLYGSLVWGDFDADISDIDLVVVTKTNINKKEFSLLDQMQRGFVEQFHDWEDRIELVYISTQALKTFKIQQSPIAVISPGEAFNIKSAGIEWLINWYMLREKSVTLYGPNPNTLIEPISKKEFLLAVKNHIRQWNEEWLIHTKNSLSFQSYAVLTICRAIYTINTGEQTSKKQAAMWFKKTYPEWAVLIDDALTWRSNHTNIKLVSSETYSSVEQFIRAMSKTI